MNIYKLKTINDFGGINKLYAGNRLIYQRLHSDYVPLYGDEIDVSFTGESLTLYLNDNGNGVKFNESPLRTSLREQGESSVRNHLNFYSHNNVTSINRLPNDIPEAVFKSNYTTSHYPNVEYINVENLNVKNLYNIDHMFSDNPKLKTIKMPDFTGANTLSMNRMFENDAMLESVDLSTLDGNKVQKMNLIFSNCSSLKNVNLNNFEGNCEALEIADAFNGCTSIKEINLPKFQGTKATDVSGIFYGCTSLEKVYMPMTNFMQSTSFNSMFGGCTALKEVVLGGGDWFNNNLFLQSTIYTHLRKFTVSNFGARFNYTQSFVNLPNWGVDGDGMVNCKKSLIDTLITYSFPQLEAVTIKLSPNTIGVLTQDEIAQITAKGYTIA